MRADKGTSVALNTIFGNPFRQFRRDVSAFMSCGAGRGVTIRIRQKSRDGYLISPLISGGLLDVADIVHDFGEIVKHSIICFPIVYFRIAAIVDRIRAR